MKSVNLLLFIILASFGYAQPDSLNQPQTAKNTPDSLQQNFSRSDSSLNNVVALIPLDLSPDLYFLPYYHEVSVSACTSRYNKAGALKDIRTNQKQILFSGGWTGGPDFNSAEDRDFQKHYGVSFYSQGCFHFGTDENEAAYNQTIFACLDKMYGKAWRYELRADAIGFKAPDNQTEKTATETNLSIQFANPGQPEDNASEEIAQENPETRTSVWWYIMPTSGFALLLGWYLVRRKKNSSED